MDRPGSGDPARAQGLGSREVRAGGGADPGLVLATPAPGSHIPFPGAGSGTAVATAAAAHVSGGAGAAAPASGTAVSLVSDFSLTHGAAAPGRFSVTAAAAAADAAAAAGGGCGRTQGLPSWEPRRARALC